MATLPRFPNIPELESGQILGATYLNALARGCEHLLGISHAAYALPHATGVLQRYQSSWGDMATYWMLHTADTVAYWFMAGEDHGNRTWQVRLQYRGDDDAWHTAAEWSGTGGWEARVGTLDLSGATALTVGRIYAWRWQGKTSDETYHTALQVRYLATRATITGWVSPPTIGTGTSSSTPLNTYRADLLALNALLPPTNALSYCEDGKKHTHTQGDWVAWTRFAYRYRPNGLMVGLWGNMLAASWNWRVRLADVNGNEATVYSSPNVAAVGDWKYESADIDLTSGAAATALAAAGITLKLGAGYLVTIEAKRNSDDHALNIRRALCVRTSNGTPGGSWANNKLWAHKDRNVGPTQLNKVRTDLLELYTGGAEELWGDSHAAAYVADEERPCSGVHRMRYLNYRCAAGRTPTLLYGAGFAQEYGLPTGEGWLGFDLSSVGLPAGAAYYVVDVEAAFEAEGIYGEA